MKTFVIGDIHGAYQSLVKCLKQSKFDKKQDRLICLGDVCDRGREVSDCIYELMSIKNCVFLLGNHDDWALHWAITGEPLKEWWEQGGMLTAMSYPGGMPKAHVQFLMQAKLYFVENNRLFVHGGFDPAKPIQENPKDILIWDRSLLKTAQELNASNPDYKFAGYDEIYVGHTPTTNFGFKVPVKFCNIWAMDTGAGHGDRLTIMDIETKKYWQS